MFLLPIALCYDETHRSATVYTKQFVQHGKLGYIMTTFKFSNLKVPYGGKLTTERKQGFASLTMEKNLRLEKSFEKSYKEKVGNFFLTIKQASKSCSLHLTF